MARNNLPNDLKKDFEESGLKFDDEGNIIEDDFDIVDNSEEDQGADDPETEIEEESETQDDEDPSDESSDEYSEEPEEEPKSKPEQRKTKLTPRNIPVPKNEPEEELSASQKKLLEQIEKLSNNTDIDDAHPDDAIAELRREARAFKEMRLKEFASSVKRSVSSLNLNGESFEKIISSEQWSQYLNSKAYGTKIGTLYINAIDEQDMESVVGFFEDFRDRYLKDDEPDLGQKAIKRDLSAAKKVKKESLEDLAVPDKTKSLKVKRLQEYDFKEDDYLINLDKFERGKMSQSEWLKFTNDFEEALRKGRVK